MKNIDLTRLETAVFVGEDLKPIEIVPALVIYQTLNAKNSKYVTTENFEQWGIVMDLVKKFKTLSESKDKEVLVSVEEHAIIYKALQKRFSGQNAEETDIARDPAIYDMIQKITKLPNVPVKLDTAKKKTG